MKLAPLMTLHGGFQARRNRDWSAGDTHRL
jgi:hypothetical protein